MKELLPDVSRRVLEILICDLLYNHNFHHVTRLCLNKIMLHKMYYYFTNSTSGTVAHKYIVVKRYLDLWEFFDQSFQRSGPSRCYLIPYNNLYGQAIVSCPLVKPVGIQFIENGPIEKTFTTVAYSQRGCTYYFKGEIEDSAFTERTVCIRVLEDIFSLRQVEKQLQEYYHKNSRVYEIRNAIEYGWKIPDNIFLEKLVFIRPRS